MAVMRDEDVEVNVSLSTHMQYWQVLGMAAEPFMDDANFVWSSPAINEDVPAINHALNFSNDTVLVIGPCGIGKTITLEALNQQLKETHTTTILDGDAALTPQELFFIIQQNLDAPNIKTFGDAQSGTEFFAQLKAPKQPMVILIDDAERLPQASLELIEHIMQSQSSDAAWLHFALFGDIELLSKCSKEHCHSITLAPLDADMIGEYCHARMQHAGFKNDVLFTAADIQRIAHASKGYFPGIHSLSRELLKKYAKDIQHGKPRIQLPIKKTLVVFFSLFVLSGLILGFWLSIQIDRNVKLERHKPLNLPPLVQQQLPRVAIHSESSSAKDNRHPALDEPLGIAHHLATHPIVQDTLSPSPEERVSAYHDAIKHYQKLMRHTAVIDTVIATPDLSTQIKPKTKLKAKTKLKTKIKIHSVQRYPYAIQIIGAHDVTKLKRFAKQKGIAKRVHIYRTEHAHKTWFILTMGDYASRRQAHSALLNLPPTIKSLKPWVRAVKSLSDVTHK